MKPRRLPLVALLLLLLAFLVAVEFDARAVPSFPKVVAPPLDRCDVCRGPYRPPKHRPSWARVQKDGTQVPIHETCARIRVFDRLRLVEGTIGWRPSRRHDGPAVEAEV